MNIIQADNHNYLSGTTKAGKEPFIAVKPTPDVYCEFRMNKLEGEDKRSTLYIPSRYWIVYLSRYTQSGGYI